MSFTLFQAAPQKNEQPVLLLDSSPLNPIFITSSCHYLRPPHRQTCVASRARHGTWCFNISPALLKVAFLILSGNSKTEGFGAPRTSTVFGPQTTSNSHHSPQLAAEHHASDRFKSLTSCCGRQEMRRQRPVISRIWINHWPSLISCRLLVLRQSIWGWICIWPSKSQY